MEREPGVSENPYEMFFPNLYDRLNVEVFVGEVRKNAPLGVVRFDVVVDPSPGSIPNIFVYCAGNILDILGVVADAADRFGTDLKDDRIMFGVGVRNTKDDARNRQFDEDYDGKRVGVLWERDDS